MGKKIHVLNKISKSFIYLTAYFSIVCSGSLFSLSSSGRRGAARRYCKFELLNMDRFWNKLSNTLDVQDLPMQIML